MLIDEFADLNLTYQKQETDEEGGSSSSQEASFFIYAMQKMDDVKSSTALRRTLVEGKVRDATEHVNFLSKDSTTPVVGEDDNFDIPAYGFVIKNDGKINWTAGMAYGMEFMHLELPPNYIFGSSHSRETENPIEGAGTIVFDAGVGSGNGLITGGSNGRNSIEICSLRSDGGGGLTARRVAVSENPEKAL